MARKGGNSGADFVPYDKMSRKKKREIDKQKRGNWGGVNPVSKPFNDKRHHKKHSEDYDEDDYM